jgi:hypothetical protein
MNTSNIISGLGGWVAVRNGDELDYSWREAVESLLPICEQVVICDSDSTDGTKEAMQRMADKEPRIKLVNYPWPNPKGESHHWFLKWLEFCKSSLATKHYIYLDADEVLSDTPECHQAIREAVEKGKCLAVDRLNFWRDAKSLIPEGHCCGKWCVRCAPTSYEVTSDEPNHKGDKRVVDEAIREPRVQIFHLGFLRKTDSFYKKARVVLEGWFARFDYRLEKAEKEDKPLWESECEFTDLLVPFAGYMPDAVQRWLVDRGHWVEDYVPLIVEPKKPKIEVVESTLGEPVNVLHSGDYGDLVYCLSVCKDIGNVNLYFIDRSINKPMLHRLHVLTPLLKALPYVNECKPHEGEPIHWNASDFRQYHKWTQNLSYSHLLHYRGQHLRPITWHPELPWITDISPDNRAKNRVLIHRSPRYHNEHFKWPQIVKFYGDACLFVGLPDEHRAFCEHCGEVEYMPTKDLLEVAQLVKASFITIANQSVVLAIAQAMKHRLIAEVSIYQPDVVMPASPECQYVADGACMLPGIGDKESTAIGSGLYHLEDVNRMMVPPGRWQYPTLVAHSHFSVLLNTVVRQFGMTREEADHAIIAHNASRVPDFFRSPQREQALFNVTQAKTNATLR